LGRDLMFQQESKETVQRAYAAIATDGGERVARRHYSDHELAEVPRGCPVGPWGGRPRSLCRLQPGGRPSVHEAPPNGSPATARSTKLGRRDPP
jgi:hypothetical protein